MLLPDISYELLEPQKLLNNCGLDYLIKLVIIIIKFLWDITLTPRPPYGRYPYSQAGITLHTRLQHQCMGP